jgi:hypothetical protein
MLGSLLSSLIATMAGRRAPEPNLEHLLALEKLDKSNCLIRVDYPYKPRHRAFDESTSKIFRLIDSGSHRYTEFLTAIAAFKPFFERIPVYAADAQTDLSPRWMNGWIPGLDAITLYGQLALHNPRWYVEVGSGNSTMFARQAIEDHGLRTSIVSIDPVPRADIDKICDRVIREPCEDVSAEFFDSLSAEDILFVDNSHRSFQSSDVTVFFTEMLPDLPSGMIYGLHDIFLPWDYPKEWQDRYYNEQYLLACYLLGGAGGDEIISPNAFLSSHDSKLLDPLAATLNNPKLQGIQKTGAAFWMRRTR